jgi:hypothetical protein
MGGGQMVKVVDFNADLPLTAMGLKPARDFGFFYVRKRLWFYSGVHLSLRGTRGFPPPVKLESCHKTYSVLVQSKNPTKVFLKSRAIMIHIILKAIFLELCPF